MRHFVIYPNGNVQGFNTLAEYDRAIAEHGAVDYTPAQVNRNFISRG